MSIYNGFRYFIIVTVGFLYFLSTPCLASDILILGRAPQLSPTATSRDWTPFVQYLNQETGFTIKLRVYAKRAKFEEDLRTGQLDLFYGNPGYGVVGHHLHNYQPLVRSSRKVLQGIVVTRADSPYQTLQQLQGHTLIFPTETAFAASLYLREQLRTHEKLDFKAKYLGSHDNVYRGVLIGKYAAGGGVERTFNREPERLRKQLKIVYKTPGIAPHSLAAHPRIGQAAMSDIRETVLKLKNTEEGRQMLDRLKIQQPVAADYQRDYQPIERLSLQMYHYLIR